MSPMFYSEAKTLMESARNPGRGKPLQNNTRLYERSVPDPRNRTRRITVYAVQLHNTDVVTIYPDYWELATNGWTTVTTQDRINSYAPGWVGSNYRGDGWMLPIQNPAPEPSRGERSVPHPFHATDPGPEPIKSAEGCIAGTKLELPFEDTAYLFGVSGDLCAEVAFENVDGNWSDFTSWTADSKYLVAHRADIERIEYGEERYRYHWNGGGTPGFTYEQCPHCKAFEQLHERWHVGMYGERWGRSRGKGWELYSEMMETYGSRDEWLAAAREDLRQVKQANVVWREWYYANHVPFFDGVRVDYNGRVTRKQADAYFLERRKRDRAEKRRQREYEARQRRARYLERRRNAYMQRQEARTPRFERLASSIALNIREAREVLTTNESLEVTNG